MNHKLSNAATCVVVPAGVIGIGLDEAQVRAGASAGAHAIAIDAGSTDSGASALATGRSKYSRDAIKHDLGILMRVREEVGIPLLIGSCGTSGNDIGVDWTRDIALEIAREEGLRPRIALLYSELDPADLVARAAAGKVAPLPPMTSVEADAISGCDHIVALMGPEPYIDALRAGADIVLGGRTTDTAVIAAMALMRGAGAGPAWHAAKISECGALCTVDPMGGGVLVRVEADAFEVEPLAAGNRCNPYTASAHMLYENSDPFVLVEPGGVLDVSQARYRAIDDRSVRVEGSRWTERPYTMKLEGASSGAYQTLMLIGIRDPKVMRSMDVFLDRMKATLVQRVDKAIGKAAGDYDISLRAYGWNAMSGNPPPAGTAPPREAGILFVATAATQDLATRIAKTCNPIFFHFPLERDMELPSYGFAFSPAEIERGQVHEFRLNHVVAVDSPSELVRTGWIDLGQDGGQEPKP